MKYAMIIGAALISLSSFANEITFEGKVVDAVYKSLNGKACTLRLESREPMGDQKIAYTVQPRIAGETYSIFNKKKPPVKEMIITDLEARGDVFAKKGELVGMGSKHRHGGMIDMSQRIYVEFDPSGSKVVGWRYLDQWYGNWFNCR
jgi:hypothetical protein